MRTACVFVLALAVVAGSGCGGTEKGRVFGPKVISAAEVSRYAPGSPARAALEMARAIQFNAPGAVARFFAPQWHVRPQQLALAFKQVAPLASRAGAPKIVTVRTRGDTARVDASWLGIPLSLPWRRIDGQWRLLPIRDLSRLQGLAP